MRLNRLTDETRARIVISSSWRRFACWQDLGPALARHGVTGEVVGETPDLVSDAAWREMWRMRPQPPVEHERIQRGIEIGEWLLAHPEVVSFAILDDGSDMVCLRLHLVQTDPNVGLDDPDVERARRLLVGDLCAAASINHQPCSRRSARASTPLVAATGRARIWYRWEKTLLGASSTQGAAISAASEPARSSRR